MLIDSFLSSFLNLLNTFWNPPLSHLVDDNHHSSIRHIPHALYQFLSNASFIPSSSPFKQEWNTNNNVFLHSFQSSQSYYNLMPPESSIHSIPTTLLQILNNSSSNVPTNSSPICDYRLFKLGPLSREGYNASVINNICPDSIFTPIVSGVFLLIYLCVVLMGVLGVMWKRKSGHVKARNPVYMILTVLASLFFVVLNCLRFIVGRKVYPCILYTISFFIIPPAIGLPTIVRCIRIFFMYKLSTQKTTMFEAKRKSVTKPADASTSQTNSRTRLTIKTTSLLPSMTNSTNPENAALPHMGAGGDQSPGVSGQNHHAPVSEVTTNSNTNSNTTNDTTNMIHLAHTNENGVTDLNSEASCSSKNEIASNNQQYQQNLFGNVLDQQGSLTAAVEMKDISIEHHPNDTTSKDRDTIETKTDESDSIDEDSRSWFTNELDSEISQNNIEMKKLKLFRGLVSYKFILALYAIIFFVHLAIWAIFGGADEAAYQQSGKHVFLWNVGMFVFDTGCVTNTNTVFLLAAEAFFYIVVEIVFIIMFFFADRDTWGIKKETFVLLLIQIGTALAYLICGQIEVIRFLTDYFVPYGFTLLTYSLVEVFISVVLPVCYAISHDRREKGTYGDSEVELLLKNKKAFGLLLDFATRSYCAEDILAYQDFEKYKKMSSRNRKKFALSLLNKYLKSGAPLELNISGLEQKHDILLKIISDSSVPSRDLFEDIKILCLNNMIDVFERLKASNKEVREMVANYKRASRQLTALPTNSVPSTNRMSIHLSKAQSSE